MNLKVNIVGFDSIVLICDCIERLYRYLESIKRCRVHVFEGWTCYCRNEICAYLTDISNGVDPKFMLVSYPNLRIIFALCNTFLFENINGKQFLGCIFKMHAAAVCRWCNVMWNIVQTRCFWYCACVPIFLLTKTKNLK